jgi:RNA polymerase sigma factor (sigma-70 family)
MRLADESARTLLVAGSVTGMNDGQLLERFRRGRNEAAEVAFAALIRRHGPMVLRVCGQLLGDRHAVDDAFQATFLVLARRAGSIRVPEQLGPWLYGVALRTAREVKAQSDRWNRAETRGRLTASRQTEDEPESLLMRREMFEGLHAEVARLPERHRAAIVLCDFEGLTHEQAAGRLGCPVGTVATRLARARRRLRDRLIRRGLAPSTIVISAVFALEKARAAVPASLETTTAHAALSPSVRTLVAAGKLSESVVRIGQRVMRTMMMARLKTAALLLCPAVVLGFGAGALVGKGQAASPALNREQGATATRAGTNSSALAPIKADDRAATDAIERRLTEMERKLDAMMTLIQTLSRDASKAGPPTPRTDPTSLRKIRPRFDCLVEKVHARVGQSVKKGDPLMDLFSTDLARAKSDCQAKFVKWQHDKNLYDVRKPLGASGAISQQLWVDTQNDEQKSRLDYNIAYDNLIVFYEVPKKEVDDAIKVGAGERGPRLTLHSPVDGTVIEVLAGPGDVSDPRSVLLVISTAKP